MENKEEEEEELDRVLRSRGVGGGADSGGEAVDFIWTNFIFFLRFFCWWDCYDWGFYKRERGSRRRVKAVRCTARKDLGKRVLASLCSSSPKIIGIGTL